MQYGLSLCYDRHTLQYDWGRKGNMVHRYAFLENKRCSLFMTGCAFLCVRLAAHVAVCFPALQRNIKNKKETYAPQRRQNGEK